MTPTKAPSGGARVYVRPFPSKEEGIRRYTFSDNELLYVAAWNGHEFEAIQVKATYSAEYQVFSIKPVVSEGTEGDDYPVSSEEQSMVLYYPIDPRMIRSDVAGATFVFPNADNDGWLFGHCDKDYMIDHEYKLLAAVTSSFERQDALLHNELMESYSSALANNDNSNRLDVQLARQTYRDLGRFREDVKAAVLSEARMRFIGWYQTNPNTPCLLYTSPSPRDS